MNLPPQGVEGVACEIWQNLDMCLYHSAYVRVYANTVAMRTVGNKQSRPKLALLPPKDRDALQEDVITFRAHFAGLFWQLNHMRELLNGVYNRCVEEGIMTAEQRDVLKKKLEDDPVLQEIREYRNFSHEFAGVVTVCHEARPDGKHVFMFHFLPPRKGQPAVPEIMNDAEIALAHERELLMKVQLYCNRICGICEGVFRYMDAKYGTVLFPRSRGFQITIPRSYLGQVPDGGATGTLYMQIDGEAGDPE